VAPVDRYPSGNPSGFKVDQSPMCTHLGVTSNVDEKVLGVRDMPQRLLQQKSELVTYRHHGLRGAHTDIMSMPCSSIYLRSHQSRCNGEWASRYSGCRHNPRDRGAPMLDQKHIHVRSVLIQADAAFPLEIP